jgi:hypothetical protein
MILLLDYALELAQHSHSITRQNTREKIITSQAQDTTTLQPCMFLTAIHQLWVIKSNSLTSPE